MHIVLLILKILGILLLVILGLLLFILLTVLFVPVRYRIQGLWKEEKWARVQVSWLLSLISFKGAYEMEKGLTGSLRVLWFKLWKTGEEENEESLESEEEENREEKKSGREKGDMVQAMEVDLEGHEKKTPVKNSDDNTPENSEKKAHHNLENDQQSESGLKQENSKTSLPEIKAKVSRNRENGKNEEKTQESEPHIPFLERIKAIWTRIQTFFQKLKFSFLHFCDKLKDIKAFVQEKKEWLEDEKNQESFRLLFKQFKKLFAHVWPCKGKGTVTFGLEDPYYTGQILTGASLLYPFFYKRLALQPVFDEKCLEAEIDYRGRIRAFYLLWLFWGIFHHKHTWKMIRGFLDRDNSSDE